MRSIINSSFLSPTPGCGFRLYSLRLAPLSFFASRTAGLAASVALGLLLSGTNVSGVTISVDTSDVVMNDFGGVGTNAFLHDVSSLTSEQKKVVKKRVQYAQFPMCRFWMPNSTVLTNPKLAMSNTTFGDGNPEWVKAREMLDVFDGIRTKFYIANRREDFEDLQVANKKDWAHYRWAELHALMVKNFRDEGYDFFALSPVNEGDHDQAEKDACWDYYENAHKALTALGIRDNVKIIAGDWRGLWHRTWQWAPVQTEYCDLLSGHRYEISQFNGPTPGVYTPVKSKVDSMKANKLGVRLIIGEFGWKSKGMGEAGLSEHLNTHKAGVDAADWVVQATRGGAQALLWWTLSEESLKGKKHGLWHDAAQGMGLKPPFYVNALMSRYIKAGSTVYNVNWPDNAVRVGAFRSPEGGWTFLMVNRAASAKTVELTVPGQTSLVNLDKYVYSNPLGGAATDYSQYATNPDGFPIPSETFRGVNLATTGISVSAPPDSVILFTNVTPGYGVKSDGGLSRTGVQP